jgi:hypothetical protein
MARTIILVLVGVFLIVRSLDLAPSSVVLVAVLIPAGLCLTIFLVVLSITGYCPSLPKPIKNWLSKTFTFHINSPSGPDAPLPVCPLYAYCTSNTPLRFCNNDGFANEVWGYVDSGFSWRAVWVLYELSLFGKLLHIICMSPSHMKIPIIRLSAK